MKFAVQSSSLTEAIHVGRLNKKGDAFLSGKEDATDLVLTAVTQFVMNNYNGGLLLTYPGMGVTVEIMVRALNPEIAVPTAAPDTKENES